MHADAVFFFAQNNHRFSVGLYFDTWTVLLAVVMDGAAIWWIYWARSQNRTKLLLASSCVPLRASVFSFARPHGKTRFPVDGFSWNFIFEYFMERPPVHMEKLDSQWTDFHEISYMNIFWKVFPSAWKNSAPSEWIFMKFHIWIFSGKFAHLHEKIGSQWTDFNEISYLNIFLEVRPSTWKNAAPSGCNFIFEYFLESPPVYVEKIVSQWRDFHEISYLNIFWKVRRENSSLIKMWKLTRVLYMKRNIHFW